MAACAITLCSSAISGAQTKTPELFDASAFETEIDGKQVSLYTITNGVITAQITNYAGYIVGVFTPDKDGNYANVVGHNDNIQQYMSFSRNPVGASLGRYANRIGNASFTLDGVEYQVTKNSGQHMLHGGSKGFDHTVWDVDDLKDDVLVLKCVLPDGLDGFPGTLTAYLTFSITEDNGLKLEYEATTDKTTVCSLSHHAYFNLEGEWDGDILDHILQISADNTTESDNSLIPTGNFLPVDGTPFDFRQPVRIGDRQMKMAAGMGFRPGAQMPEIPAGMVRSYDQNFVLNHTEAGRIEKVATLYSPKSGRFMEVLNNHPGMQVFTGQSKAIAMESQMFPDSPNRPEFPSTTLRPGETYHHTVIYRFSVK